MRIVASLGILESNQLGLFELFCRFRLRGGGSTITQQLVKNTFLKNERTFSRKILETVLALVLERTMSKQRILSSYVYILGTWY
ncbi:biosynthetic peptidoglycan transglycosylase-like [Hibiscus syriacus]|uniref:biosynthetic peptidoglycan transglycosylase-like n=1 Tax=Hibiscus syriacus TaxID=106335 RepID=UPI00192308A1|nr:biosynthetic peptidoglycan transglycosylase-like [Hibiscus syriacus]